MLFQTPLQSHKRLERIGKVKKIKKELDDEIQFISQTPLHPRKKLEMKKKKIKNIIKEAQIDNDDVKIQWKLPVI